MEFPNKWISKTAPSSWDFPISCRTTFFGFSKSGNVLADESICLHPLSIARKCKPGLGRNPRPLFFGEKSNKSQKTGGLLGTAPGSLSIIRRDLRRFAAICGKKSPPSPLHRMCEYGFTEGQDFNLLKNEQVQLEGERMVSRTVNDAPLSSSPFQMPQGPARGRFSNSKQLCYQRGRKEASCTTAAEFGLERCLEDKAYSFPS